MGKNILLLTVSLIVALVIMELVLRIAAPPVINWVAPQESYLFDSQIGHWLKPGQKSFTHDKPVNTNSAGLRDREYSLHPPSGTIRILALGDSQTFGNGLRLVETWPKQLEAILNARTDMSGSYEVINAGLAGSDTWQHEIILDRLLPKYNPHVVILAFYVNDVVKKFTPSQDWYKKHKAKQNELAYMLKKSALLLSLRSALDAVRNIVSPSDGFRYQQALLRGESNAVLDGRWQQVSTSIASMKQMCDAGNSKFVIISLPRRDQVDGTFPWSGYYGKLVSIAQQYQVPVFSMLEPLQAAYSEHGKTLFIPWDGHNTALANRAIAESISRELLK